MEILNMVTLALVLIGALNWGLVGWFNFDLVRTIFPPAMREQYAYSGISRVVYSLVGLAAVAQAYFSLAATGA